VSEPTYAEESSASSAAAIAGIVPKIHVRISIALSMAHPRYKVIGNHSAFNISINPHFSRPEYSPGFLANIPAGFMPCRRDGFSADPLPAALEFFHQNAGYSENTPSIPDFVVEWQAMSGNLMKQSGMFNIQQNEEGL
jgi:hypothetical protein